MHAFVAAILLRVAGLDAFDANTEAQPPDGEFAQMKQGVRGSEGHGGQLRTRNPRPSTECQEYARDPRPVLARPILRQCDNLCLLCGLSRNGTIQLALIGLVLARFGRETLDEGPKLSRFFFWRLWRVLSSRSDRRLRL